MHERIAEVSEQLNDRIDQLNDLLENIEDVEDKDFLNYILEDLEKAVDAARCACGTVIWAQKSANN